LLHFPLLPLSTPHSHTHNICSAPLPLLLLQIAAACGASSPTATSHLYKVLRVLAQHEMLEELPGKKFTPKAATVQLVQGEVPSLGHMASHLINPPKWDAWKVLPQVCCNVTSLVANVALPGASRCCATDLCLLAALQQPPLGLELQH
jgi:hypothetical protein